MAQENSTEWACEKCTFVQNALNDECMVCRNPSPHFKENQKQQDKQADNIEEVVIPQYQQEEIKSSMNENKNDEPAEMEDAEANLLIPDGDNYPMARLNICGKLENNNLSQTESSKRAIIFVVDKSGSMSGSRIESVQAALLQFVEQVCEDINLLLHLILFRGNATHYEIPNDKIKATSLIKQY
eukprot:494005_1